MLPIGFPLIMATRFTSTGPSICVRSTGNDTAKPARAAWGINGNASARSCRSRASASPAYRPSMKTEMDWSGSRGNNIQPLIVSVPLR